MIFWTGCRNQTCAVQPRALMQEPEQSHEAASQAAGEKAATEKPADEKEVGGKDFGPVGRP